MSDTFDKTPKILIFLAAILLIRIGVMAVGNRLYIPYLDEGLHYLLQAARDLKILADEYLRQYTQ